MRVGICSGYFQRFHTGHRRYIKQAKDACDMLIVIVNNDGQQKKKYKGFKNIRSCKEIQKEIKKAFDVLTVESIDTDGSVCATLEALRENYPTDELLFCKDADRTIANIPERAVLEKADIRLLQFTNPKENSSAAIMRAEG